RLVPAEEIIWQKSFVQERERYDGADISHLVLAVGRDLDWRRLLARFGPPWRPLVAQLVPFRFVYPSLPVPVPASGVDDPTARRRAVGLVAGRRPGRPVAGVLGRRRAAGGGGPGRRRAAVGRDARNAVRRPDHQGARRGCGRVRRGRGDPGGWPRGWDRRAVG